MRMLFAALVAAFSFSATAQDHQHPPEHASIHEFFYKNWMRPDHPTLSCCDLKDCAPAILKNVNGVWYGKRATDQNFRRIPPEKMETNRDSPDGRSHMCASLNDNETVYCAIVGAGN